MRRIVIADDHPIFRKGLAEIIKEKYPEVEIEEAHDGEEAIQLVKRCNPHLAILDIEMPRKNGMDTARIILDEFPSTRVVILTMHNKKSAFDLAMEIGAMGYVLKENAVADITQCLEQVMLDRNYVSPELSRQMLQNRSGESDFHQKLALLSPSEKRVLRWIAEYKTNKVIGEEMFLSERTVQNHRLNISKKLDLKGAHQVLRFAIEYKDLIELGIEKIPEN